MVMNSLACVAGSFLGETFINIYTALQGQTKKNDAFSPRPSPAPHCFLVQPQFSFRAVYLFIYEPQKKKQANKKTPSMQAMNSETKVKLKLVMRISS